MNLCIVSFGPVESRRNGYFVRVWNIAKEASRFYDRVVVLEFPEENVQPINKLRNITFIRLHGNESTSNKLASFFKKIITFDPLHSVKFQILSFLQLWKHRKYLSSSDIIMVEGSFIVAANIFAKLLRKKVVLDTHGIMTLIAQQYKERRMLVYFLRTLFWTLLERLTVKLSDKLIVVSEKERKIVMNAYHVAEPNLFVVPNTVEAPKLASQNLATEALRKKLRLESKIIVSFVGNLNMVQNADAAEYITSELASCMWKKRKDVVFLVIGEGEEKFEHSLPNVIFTGFVKDLASYLLVSDVCIAPLRVGCGIKTKMLEYLIQGKPIVTTFIGAEGLESTIANHTENFIKVVPIRDFGEALLTTVSDLHKIETFEIPYQTFLEDFRKKLCEALCSVSEV